MKKELMVFSYKKEEGMIPCAKLSMEEIGNKTISSYLGYGLQYLRKNNIVEIDPVQLSINQARKSNQVVVCESPLGFFGGIRDASPDAWGRRVIEAQLKVPANSLPESVYLIMAGENRSGALEVQGASKEKEGKRGAKERDLAILLEASERIETGDAIKSDLEIIFEAGVGSGGARPKANFRDKFGSLWLAKFPCVGDSNELTEIEAACVFMAAKTGIPAPETKVIQIGSKNVMAIKRFDRIYQANRKREEKLQFNSALTFLNCSEMESSSKSYQDVALAIRRYCDPERIKENLEDLYRRMVFNIFVSNDDDHLRNHGFLYNAQRAVWNLSPAYDLMPRPSRSGSYTRYQTLGVGKQGKVATIENALSDLTPFGLNRDQAIQVIAQVWLEIREWKNHFEEFGISGKAIDTANFAIRHIRDIATQATVKAVNSATILDLDPKSLMLQEREEQDQSETPPPP